ncbi:MAG TPA: diguanylate cyclase [Vicinamibacteria bacterium]|nr:diguanylate cyclase [Vicinamibacteria bacterium]
MTGDILVVDDNPNNLAVLVGLLRSSGYQARVANSGRGALGAIHARAPELVLLDINMPDLDGYEVCRELKSNPKTSAIPVLFISALDDPIDKVRAFAAGGVDYIQKPFQAEEVLARVESHLKIRRLQQDLEAHAARLEEALASLAEVSVTDPLTGLRNRRYLIDRIDDDAAQSLDPRANPGDLLFFMIDLDHFKAVNDRHGHAKGDAVLVEFARRLRLVFRASDHLVRWGGEEFLVVVRFQARTRAEDLAERVRATLAHEEIQLADGTRIAATCSIGFACFPFLAGYPAALRWQDVLELADVALYAAKRAGRNCWVGLATPAGGLSDQAIAALTSDPSGAAVRGLLRVSSSAEPERVREALRPGKD